MTSLKNLLKMICVLKVLLFLFNNNSVGQTNALELKAERLSDKIVSLDEYNSLSATQHELSSKSNEARLDSAIGKLRKRQSFQKELLD